MPRRGAGYAAEVPPHPGVEEQTHSSLFSQSSRRSQWPCSRPTPSWAPPAGGGGEEEEERDAEEILLLTQRDEALSFEILETQAAQRPEKLLSQSMRLLSWYARATSEDQFHTPLSELAPAACLYIRRAVEITADVRLS